MGGREARVTLSPSQTVAQAQCQSVIYEVSDLHGFIVSSI